MNDKILVNISGALESGIKNFITKKASDFLKEKMFLSKVSNEAQKTVNSNENSDRFIEELQIVFSDEKIIDISKSIIDEKGFKSIKLIEKEILMLFNKYKINTEEYKKFMSDLVTVIINSIEQDYPDLANNLYTKNSYIEVRSNTKTLEKISNQLDRIDVSSNSIKNDEIKQVSKNKISTLKNFIGRVEKLEEIENVLNQSNRVVLLNGIGGIGKTEISKQLFLKCLDNNKLNNINSIAFINFNNTIKSSIHNQFDNEYISFIDNSNEDEYFNKVKSEFLNKENFLLFLDNVNENSKELVEEITSFKCKVLLTSRVSFDDEFSTIEIPNLSSDECVKLYQLYCPNSSKDIVKQIVKLTNNHTLAVELLAKTQKASCSTSEKLLDLLNGNSFNLPIEETISRSGEGQALFIEHLSKIFDIYKLEEKQIEVLNLFSLLQENFSIDGGALKIIFDSNLNIFNNLSDQGWIKKSDLTFSMHPIISEVIRYKNYEISKDILDGFIERISKEIYVSSTDIFTSKLDLFKHSLSILKKLKNTTYYDEIPYSKLELNVGNLYSYQGLSLIAEKLLFHVMSVREKLLKGNDLFLAEVYNDYGYSISELKPKTSYTFHKKSLDIRIESLGEIHPDTALSYNNIGGSYFEMKDYQKALKYHNKSLEIRIKTLGENHLLVAQTYNNIACNYQEQKKYNNALKNHNKSLTMKLKILGKNHPQLVRTYNNIGSVYSDLEQYEKAFEYYDKALEIYSNTIGENHPDFALICNSVGSVYSDLEQYEKAFEYYDKGLNVISNIFDENHTYLIRILDNYVITYNNMSDFSKAREYQLKIVSIYEEKYGKQHNNTKEAIKKARELQSKAIKKIKSR